MKEMPRLLDAMSKGLDVSERGLSACLRGTISCSSGEPPVKSASRNYLQFAVSRPPNYVDF